MAIVSRSAMARSAASPWSGEELGQILGAVSDGVTVQDRSGSLVFANDAAARLLGFSDEASLLAAPIDEVMAAFELLDEGRRPFPVDRLPGRRALAGETAIPETLVLFRFAATGEERWARISARAISDGDGRVILAVNTFRDVTERRAIEERLQLQADLLDRVETAIVATDTAGAVTHWNQGAVSLFARPAREAIGRPFADVVPIEPSIAAEALAAAMSGKRWEGPAAIRRRGSRSLPVYMGVTPLRDGHATVSGVSVVCLDLSERRRMELEHRASEDRFRLLFDSLPHAVWIADQQGGVQRINRRYAEYTGVPSPGGNPSFWIELVHPADVPDVARRWDDAQQSRHEYEVEFRFRRADGVYRWHVGRVLPLLDERGEISGWLGTGTDIEDRKRAEQSLSFLAQASRVLAGSLDYEATLDSVAKLAVPEIADWCAIDLVTDAGRVEMVGIAHVDPAKIELAHEMRRRWPATVEAMTVLRTLRSEVYPEITDEMLEAVPDPEERAILQDLHLCSAMTVPLITDRHAIGAISLFTAESGRRFEPADVALAEDLARRAAAAIENARLYRSVSQFKWAVDNATDAIYMYDPESLRFTYVNRGATAQVGYSADELLGMTPVHLKPDYDEAGYRDLIRPLVEGAVESRQLETVQRRRDGTTYPVDVVLQRVPITPDGLRVIAFVRDVTERVEAQERLGRLAGAERARAAEVNAVLRAMGEAVLVFDAVGHMTLSNPAVESLFPDVALVEWADVTAMFDDPEGHMPSLAADRPQGPAELQLRDSRRWIEVTAYPVLIEDGPTGAGRESVHAGVTILVMRDVTEQREASAMRRAFVGVLSHELRTPVTTIYGSSKVLGRLEGRMSDETRREVYADIEAEAERLYRLVEDLLVLARFGDEPMVLGDEPVLLQRILPATLASERNRWPGTRFEQAIAPGLPTVRADPTYVEQVARNLLANAAKYGAPGGTVRLLLEPAARPDGTPGGVTVRVRDDGPGFPPGETDRLFELFYRSPLTAAHAPGAGIGLFVCRRLIEAMGGRIWARNLAAGGAEFGFTLGAFEDDE